MESPESEFDALAWARRLKALPNDAARMELVWEQVDSAQSETGALVEALSEMLSDITPMAFVSSCAIAALDARRVTDRVLEHLLTAIARPEIVVGMDEDDVVVRGVTAIGQVHNAIQRRICLEGALSLCREPLHAHQIGAAILGFELLGRLHVLVQQSDVEELRYEVVQSSRVLDKLSSEQAKAIGVVLRSDVIWQRDSNLLGVFGLPQNPFELGDLLGQQVCETVKRRGPAS